MHHSLSDNKFSHCHYTDNEKSLVGRLNVCDSSFRTNRNTRTKNTCKNLIREKIKTLHADFRERAEG
jgi:hypothetical protein